MVPVMEGDNKLLGANVGQLREKAGMSQASLAAAMSERGWPWHQSTVGRVEAGQQPLKLAEAVDLARVLKTSLDRLTWPTPEASAHGLLAMMLSRAAKSREQIAAGTVSLLWAQRQLRRTVAETEALGLDKSERLADLVREARQVIRFSPRDALAEGRARHRDVTSAAETAAGRDDDGSPDPEGQPRIHDQRDT